MTRQTPARTTGSPQVRGSALALFAFLLAGGANAQLTVAPQSNLQQLASAITGTGVTISNPSVACHSLGYGEYSYSGSGMNITEGVILTTGRINDALGPNNSTGSGNWFAQNTAGDALLNNVTGRTTYDACKFEFDIIPTGDSLRFDFTFGSEEYNEWVGSQFNDVFGFFISGPGITGDPGASGAKNIALIPGTNTAVTINNVNNGANQTYYQDNTGGSQTQYDGYTVDLSAQAVVQPCQSYHLKLVVADASDRKFDSGVFIEKIQSPTVSLSTYTQSGAPDMIEACNPGWIRFDRGTPRPSPLTLQYYLQGTATNGADYTAIGNVNPAVAKSITIPANAAYVDRPVNPLFDNITEPDEYIRIILGNPNCPSTPLDTALFFITDSIFTTISGGGTICQGDSVQLNVTGGANYSWSPATGLSCTNCPNPWAHPTNTTTYSVLVTDGSCTRTMSRQVRVSKLALSASVTQPLCEGASNGAINVTHSLGIAPYTYSWTGPNGFTASTEDITNVPSGTYTLTMSDAACTRAQSWNVIDPAILTVSLNPAMLPFGQNIACNGGNTGSITSVITGGTVPYTIAWTGPGGYTSSNANISGLIAGAYTINITDSHGCTATASTTLTESPAISFSANTTANVLCFGANIGAASSSISGGIPPYSWSWNSTPVQTSQNASGLAPGNYTVTLTDSYSCSTSANVTIGGPTAALTTTLTAQTNVLCFGNSTGSAGISVSGGTGPYTTSWYTTPVQNGNTATNLPAGTWTATVTDANGCQTTRSVTITEPASGLSAVLFAQTNVLCFGNSTGSATVSASGGTGPYTYQWNTTPAQNTATASNLPAGNYTCTVRDVNLCVATVNVTITQPAAALSTSIAAQTNVLCFGNSTGSASINVSGGTSPYAYAWNTSPVQNTASATGLPAGTWTCTVTDANGCSTTRSVIITQPAAALSGSVTAQTNVLCFGNSTGSATVTISGGTVPYSYSWNTTPAQNTATASNLPVGSYICTITDTNGCSITRNVTITEPAAALTASISAQTNVLCFGNNTGSATVSVSGGTTSYSYAWNTTPVQTGATASGLVAGTYTCTITDANGCSTSASVTITQPAAALSTSIAAQTNVLCFGNSTGSASINVSGGTSPYAYAWNTSPVQNTASATGLPAGTWTCTVTDANGCSTTRNVTITQPAAALSGSVTAQTNVLCFGNSTGSATVTINGGTLPYSYSWNTTPVQNTATASNLPAGSYTCTITDNNGCSITRNVTITQPAATLSASISAQTNVLCFGNNTGSATVSVSGGTTSYSYAWNTTPVQTGATASGLVAGTYTCTVTDANGCSTSASVTITQPAAALSTSIAAQTNVLCFGNSTGSASINVTGGTAPYAYSWNTSPVQNTASATGLPAGTWTCTVTDANGCSTTRSVIITQPAAALAISGTIVPATCGGAANGAVNATIIGGTSPYSYAWIGPGAYSASTEDINNIVAGAYTLTVTDANGCTASQSFSVNQPGLFSASGIASSYIGGWNVSCAGGNNGAIDMTVSGGTTPYTHAWTGPNGYTSAALDITGLQAGSYNYVLTDANGCSTSASFNLTQPTPVAFSTNSTQQITCNGDANAAVSVTASGGTAPLTYSWTGPGTFSASTAAITGLQPGTYTLVVSDANGCTDGGVNTWSFVDPAILAPNAAATSQVSCFGGSDGSAVANVTGGITPYTINWNTSPAQAGATAVGLTAGTYMVTVTDARGCVRTQNVIITQPAAALNASIGAQTNVLCFGDNSGSATLTVNGGTAPYSYSWNTTPAQNTATASNLPAGSYACTITDVKGCSTGVNVTITQPAVPLSASIGSSTDVLCFGNSTGSANAVVAGGTAPYTYSWNSVPAQATANATGLPAGTFTCMVTDAHGCTVSANTTITQPAAPLASSISAQTNVACFGNSTGSTSVSVNGGTPAYSYSWNTVSVQVTATATGLSAGPYACTITDANGCSVVQNVTITQPAAALTASITAQTNVLIFGQSTGAATVTASNGTAPYAYSWSNGQSTATATGLSAGSYSVTVTDANGCTVNVSVTITQPGSALGATLVSQVNVDCFGNSTGSATVTANGGTAPYSFSWNTTPAQNSPSASNLAAGNYSCTVTDNNGAITSVNITIIQPASALIANIASQTNVDCFGNSTGNASVSASGGTPTYTMVWNTSPAQNGASANGLLAGNYICTITDANGCGTTQGVTITEPAAPLIASIGSQTNVDCFGNNTGSATANASGGTAPYSYSWNTATPQSSATATGLSAGTWTCTIIDAHGCTTSVGATITQPLAALSASITSTTQATCGVNNGTATTSVSGGTSPYSYAWNSTPPQVGASLGGVGAGTYTCIITDANGCSTNTVANITSPSGLSLSLLGTSAQTCFGTANGQATVAASGGSAPYTITWNTVPAQNGATASGLLAGTYTATVHDANGCTAMVNATIAGPSAPLTLTASNVTDVLCFGGATGAATVSPNGGLMPYSIVWNTLPVQSGASATNLTAGTWTATVTDGFGCSASANAVVHQPVAPVDGYVDAQQNVSCNGGNNGFATIEATGGSGSWTMEWNTVPAQFGATATGLGAGFYFVSISDNNGCNVPKQVPVTITEPAAPLALNATASNYNGYGVSCAGSLNGSMNVTTSGGTAPYTFSWTGPGGFTATSEDISGLSAGTYALVATDANGCTQSLSMTLSSPAIINTATSVTTASCNGTSTGAVDATTTGGVAPYTYAWSGANGFTASSEDISNIPAGVYSLSITDANGCSSTFFSNVSEPGVFNVNATLSAYSGGNNVSCAASSDGSIDATASGGTLPYSYTWNGPGSFSASTEDISGLVAGTYNLTLVDANGCGTLAQYTLTAPAPLFNTLAPVTYPSGGNVSCDGAVDGVIDATISGGTPAYLIAWTGPNGYAASTEDINSLMPGDYTMAVTDANGCTTTQSVTLNSPSQLNASLSVSQYNSGDAVSCNGGSNGIIDLAISGGVAPYSVNWSGPGGYTSNSIDISGLSAGTYTALVNDAAGCDTTISVTLTEPTPVQASGITSDFNGFGVSCYASSNGSIDITASGGAGNYTYLWTGPNAFVSNDEDINGIIPGSYDAIVSDMNGCKLLLNFTLDAPPAIATSAVISSAACQGAADGAIDLTITGGVPGYTVQWNGPAGFNAASEDITSLFAGIYTTTITDANGCSYSQPYDVNEPGLFTVTAITTTYPGGYGVSCAGASDGAIDITASGGTAPLFFSWQGPNGFNSISEDINGLAAGTYDLTLTDANGCNRLESWTITAPTAINIGLSPSQFADGSNVACSGGANASIDASIIGGVAPYSITWSGPNGFVAISEDITGLSAGVYTMSVTDAIGCSASSAITLTEPQPIDIDVTTSQYISGGNISCNGSTDGSIDLTVTGGSLLYFVNWTGPNGFVSNNADISGLVAGNYNVVITDANGCTANASVNLIQPDPILIDLTVSQYGGGFSIGCNGTTGNVDAHVQGGAVPWTYQWTGPNGFTSNAQDLNGVPAGTYDLLVTDAAGCTATATATLTEPTSVDMTATISNAGNGYEVGCAGNDGAITLDLSGGVAPYTTDWSGTSGFASLNEDLSGLGAGTYTVVVTDVNGCVLQQIFTLEQATALALTTAVSGNMCDGLDDGAIDLSVGGGVAPFNVAWSGPNGFSSANEDISTLSAGQYVADVTDANGCSAQTMATIAASSPIDLSLYVSDYGDVNIPCVGSSTGVIEATINGGAGSLDILWNGPNGFSSNAAALSGLIAGDYVLSITDDNGCSLDTTVSLTEPATPIDASFSTTVQASGTNVSCFGGNDGSVDLSVTGGVAPYDITWHGPAGTSFDTEDISGAIAGHYDVVITDVNGCSLTDSITLTEPDSALMADISVSQYNGGFNVSCDGNGDGSIGASATGGSVSYAFAWTGPGGFTSSSDSISGLQEGTYVLTITDLNGCIYSQPIDVVAPDPITWSFDAGTFPSGTNISCFGMSDGSISTSVSGGSGTFDMLWTGPNGFTASDPEISGLIAGEYCATITDANGCAVSDCITLSQPDTLIATAVSGQAACGQSNGSVDATVTGGSVPYMFDWNNDLHTEDISGVPAGPYALFVTDMNGCQANTSAQVQGAPALSISSMITDVLCHGGSSGAVDLTVQSGTAPYNFDWIGSAAGEDLTDVPAGGYQVTVTDANNCTWSDVFTIHEPDALGVDSVLSDYGNGHEVSGFGASDGSIALTTTGGTAPYAYDWSNGGNSDALSGLTAGNYSVTITDANGCTVHLEFTLTQPTTLEMPTGFTPNGDGQNDVFIIHGIEGYRENQLIVFNRWGNVVYDRLNYRNDWRGENQEGQQLPNGTYFIILRLGRDALNLQGYVDLRR